MNRRIFKITSVLTTLIIVFSLVRGASLPLFHGNRIIVGTWVSEEDIKWKLVFTSENKLLQYYKNELVETDSVVITNSSPQCGETVVINEFTNFLQLTDLSNGEKTCYEINGISKTSLSLRVIGRGGALVFTRQ
jgi:hypothetical protein